MGSSSIDACKDIPKSSVHAVKLQLVCIRQQLFVKKVLAKRES